MYVACFRGYVPHTIPGNKTLLALKAIRVHVT